MKWINFLHFYQPVHIDAHIVEEATDNSYLRIVRALLENPQAKFNFNINGCLILRWEELGYRHLIEDIKKLLDRGQIDLSGTAAYHPLIPLIPEKEAVRQIKENEAILARVFSGYKPTGFFFPEMAYSPEAARLVKSLGYQWVILDEIAHWQISREIDYTVPYIDENSGLYAVLRERKASNSYVPKTIDDMLDKKDGREIIITTTDAELYGLRHTDKSRTLEKILKRPDLTTERISDFVRAGKEQARKIKPLAHSWATGPEEFKKNEPFNLWREKDNIVQKKLWDLAEFVYNAIEKYRDDENYNWARWHFVRGLSSCTFWWASAKDFRLFGPISWSPDEIERGTNELIRSIRALESEDSREYKLRAEKKYVEIKKIIWEQHWTYYWKKNAGSRIQ